MNTASPRTSIIMPVYKTGQRVVAAIESVLYQTDPDFELLIMVDGSPDDSSDRIRSFLEQCPDSRVRVFDNPVNQGLSAVRNQGIAQARGEWLAFLDSDDRYRPNFLSTLHAFAEAAGADVAVAGHTLVEVDGSTRDRFRARPGVRTGQEATLELLSDRLTPYAWDKIIRASTVRGVTFPEDIHRAEDAVFSLHACTGAQKVVVVPSSLYEYTVDAGGLTWGRVTPLAESERLLTYIWDATATLLGSSQGKKAYATQKVLTLLNTAQQALMADNQEVVRAVRAKLRWSDISSTSGNNAVFAAAAVLLKLSPALYSSLYGAYVRRQYGI